MHSRERESNCVEDDTIALSAKLQEHSVRLDATPPDGPRAGSTPPCAPGIRTAAPHGGRLIPGTAIRGGHSPHSVAQENRCGGRAGPPPLPHS